MSQHPSPISQQKNATICKICPDDLFLQSVPLNQWRGELTFQIVNSLGQHIQTISMEKNEAKNSLELDVKNLPNGIYRLLVSDGDELVVQSFIKI